MGILCSSVCLSRFFYKGVWKLIQEILKAFMFIFIAEMGDKTQVLAMAFATKYPVKKVLLGILIGSFLNHALAVLLGNYLSSVIPINLLQVIAGFAFVGFALWTLYSDDEEENGNRKIKFGPVFTVALAFFLGELGDKTQLTAITLAAESNYPALVLCGTVLGMIVTGGIGILVGKTIGKRIPEYVIKIGAASVFMFFGILKLSQTLPVEYLTPLNITLFVAAIVFSSFLLLRNDYKKRERGIHSELKSKAQALYDYYHKMDQEINKICLGEQYCGECDEKNCLIACLKTLIKAGINEKYENLDDMSPDIGILKAFDKHKLLEALIFTVEFKQTNETFNEPIVDLIQKNIEIILFGFEYKNPDNLKVYLNSLKAKIQEIEE